jgi:DNA-binding MarR family transcriptional regulator
MAPRVSPPRLTYQIKWLERRIRLELEAALAPLGISVPEYTALSVLGSGRELSSAQLARRTFVTAQAMNPIVLELARRNLIARHTDPDHGRIQRLKLTDRGSKILSECDRCCTRVEQRVFDALTRTELTTLRATLAKCLSPAGGAHAARAERE